MRERQDLANLLSLLTVATILLFFSLNAPLQPDNYVFSRAISPSFATFCTGSPVTMQPMGHRGDLPPGVRNAHHMVRPLYRQLVGLLAFPSAAVRF